MRLSRAMTLIAVAASLIVSGASAAPASAAQASGPVIVSPVSGGTLPVGSTALVIDFPIAGTYSVSVSCKQGGKVAYFWWNSVSGATYPTYSAGAQSVTIDPLVGLGSELSGASCEISSYGTGATSTGFTTTFFTVTGSSAPTVVSPAPGSSLPRGSTGPLVIDFPVLGGSTIKVSCVGGGTYTYYTTTGGPAGRRSIPMDALEAGSDADLSGATCYIDLNGNYKPVQSTFTLTAPTLALGDLWVSKQKFYPVVKDGYLDKVTFGVNSNRTAEVTLTIKDRTGKTVHAKSGRVTLGQNQWTWDGKVTGGKTAAPGSYTATVSATADGAVFTSTTRVTVATKKVKRKVTLRRAGWNGTDSTRGNCIVRTDTDAQSSILDCWGGAYAASTYAFTIPADATNIRWRAATAYTDLDKCCRGTITKTGSRVGKTKFRVRVQATGWRATEVTSVRVSFRGTIRI